MTNEELNTALYEKMFAEQQRYREWLLSQPPDEILNHCYEFTVREDIVLALEYHDLSDKQCKALLQSRSPLADVFKDFEKRETDHMDNIRDTIECRANAIIRRDFPYLPKLSSNAVTKQIVPLTNENIRLACDCCGFPTDTSCAEKERFLRSCGQEIYGFLHTDERGNLLGGAEYLPSMLVPYDIPHSEDAAFITCVYLSDAEYDYKSAPIKALEQYLRKTYARAFAVTDEKGVFPNGDLAFFTRNGYRDNGVIFEDQAYCKLHLVSKDLNE